MAPTVKKNNWNGNTWNCARYSLPVMGVRDYSHAATGRGDTKSDGGDGSDSGTDTAVKGGGTAAISGKLERMMFILLTVKTEKPTTNGGTGVASSGKGCVHVYAYVGTHTHTNFRHYFRVLTDSLKLIHSLHQGKGLVV